MPRAILKGGVIYPIEPLPAEWADGRELLVEDAEPDTPESIDQWLRDLEALVAQIDPDDDKRLRDALEEADRLEKAGLWRQRELVGSPPAEGATQG
jgi:hypothetical protein